MRQHQTKAGSLGIRARAARVSVKGMAGARDMAPDHLGRRITKNRNDKAKPELLFILLQPPEGAS